MSKYQGSVSDDGKSRTFKSRSVKGLKRKMLDDAYGGPGSYANKDEFKASRREPGSDYDVRRDKAKDLADRLSDDTGRQYRVHGFAFK